MHSPSIRRNENSGARETIDSAINPITVTVSTGRRISGLGNTTLWKLIKNGDLQVVRVGRRTLITMASLQALLAPRVLSQFGPRRRGWPRKLPQPEASE